MGPAALVCLTAGLIVIAGLPSAVGVSRATNAQAPRVVRPVADAHTSASHPRRNFGSSSSLRLDGFPRYVGYIRFRGRGVRRDGHRVSLRVYARRRHRAGIFVRAARSPNWRERRVTHSRRPRILEGAVARSGPIRKRGWVSLDVTRVLRGSGVINLVLGTASRRGLRLASREAGSRRAPRLVVQKSARRDPAGPAPEGTIPPAAGGSFHRRPYSDDSPWNMPIGPSPAVHPLSSEAVGLIGGPITSDPTQYTYPLYLVDASTPVRTVELSGVYSNVTGSQWADTTLTTYSGQAVSVPLRDEFSPADGSDAQIIVVNPATGDEWGFWKLHRNSAGAWAATNGYHYNVYWDGHPPRTASGSAFGSRGAGVTYLAGLVRPYEVARGRIDHALAFAFGGSSAIDHPRNTWVFPAAKSDGKSTDPRSLPEGARLQLDPGVTDAELRALGCSEAALTIAHAMQEYGMYVVDNSGSDKVMLEYSGTADWSALGVDRRTASCIPLGRLRWVS